MPFSSVQESGRRLGDPFRSDLTAAQPAADCHGEHIVCRGTRISRRIENRGRYRRRQRRRAVDDRLGKMFPGQITGGLVVAPGARITAHFQPDPSASRRRAGSRPIDAILTRLGQLQGAASSARSRGGRPRDSLMSCRAATLRDTLGLLEQEADVLPPSIRPLVTQIGARSERILVRGAASDLAVTVPDPGVGDRALTSWLAVIRSRPAARVKCRLSDFGRIFGDGGVFDAFFTANLEQLVDRTQQPVDVASWGSIRCRAYSSSSRWRSRSARRSSRPDRRGRTCGSSSPSPSSTTGPRGSARRRRSALRISARRPTRRTRRVARTGARLRGRPTSRTVRVFQRDTGSKGPWAWFRFIDTHQVQAESETRTVLTIHEQSNHQARVVVEATSLQNPFINRDVAAVQLRVVTPWT